MTNGYVDLSTNQTVAGNKNFTGTTLATVLESVVSMDGSGITDLAAAVTKAATGGGTSAGIFVPAADFILPTSVVNFTNVGVGLFGRGFTSDLVAQSTNDNVAPQAALSLFSNLQWTQDSTSTRSGKAIIHPTTSGGSQGFLLNNRFTGNVTTADNASVFLADHPITSQCPFY